MNMLGIFITIGFWNDCFSFFSFAIIIVITVDTKHALYLR